MSTYMIGVSFDDGTHVAKKTAFAEDVPAGATASFDATAPGYSPASKLACTVTSVDRVKA